MCSYTYVSAQDQQIAVSPINQQEFEVRSLTGVPYTIIFEGSKIDGQYHLASNGSLTFKTADMVGTKSTLRIKFEKEMHLSMENKLVEDYRSDVEWVKSMLDITEKKEFELFPSRPIMTDEGFDKLKTKVFEYATTESKERYFYQWMDKVNYSVGAFRFFKSLYNASNGEDNEQRPNFLPINVYEVLHQ
ncbi:hypothetical protein GCM10022393_27630 [Aquimarina addita]|uniref:DUF4369 domain-containing protein n=1 Tax=Aquimarina addita TaxID=870485 RepID=A0ABP6UPL4_9FLAO